MLEEIIKNYRKKSIKVAVRMVYSKFSNCNIYSIYNDYG